ncbi:MAG: MFS transporter [Armatimonadetes bacterium]|nr:MFS transporter [Armatimonadota bacterium]
MTTPLRAAAERRRPSITRMDVWALLVPFLADGAVMTATIGFPLAAIRLDATPQQLGIVGAASPLAFVAACLTLGHLSDGWGRRGVGVAGTLALILALGAAYHAGSVTTLAVAAALVGVAGGIFWPAVEGGIADAYGHGPLGRGLFLFNIGWTGGMSLGAWAGGQLADLSPSLPFAAGAGVTLVMLPLVAAWPASTPDGKDEHPPAAAPVPLPVVDRFLLFARIANCGTYFGVACLRTLFPKLGTELGFSGSEIGLLVALLSFTQTLAFYPLIRSRRWQYRLGPLLATELVMALALVGIARASAPLAFMALLAVLGAGSGLTYLASLFYSLNRPTDRGKMGALHEAFLGGGSMLGPLLGGTLAQHTNLRAPYLLCAVVMVVAALIQVALRPKR